MSDSTAIHHRDNLPPDIPPQTDDDPTSGGYFCGSPVRNTYDDGHRWCRNRAGFKTAHVGIGKCHLHGGNSPSHVRNVQLRFAELVGPAIARLARIVTDDNQPGSVHIRAAEAILNRAGYPAATSVEMADDRARELLRERILDLRNATDYTDDGTDR